MSTKERNDLVKPIDIEFSEDDPILPIILQKILSIEHNSKTHLYFRGEKKKHPYIIPSLYRDDNQSLVYQGSEYYYRNLLSQLGKDDYSESATLVRLMAEFRHYGAVTRILDVSINPLAALYFAVEGADDEEGYLYVFESNNWNTKEKFDTGHTIAIKTALNLIEQPEIDSFLKCCKILLEKYDEKDIGIGDYVFYSYATTEELKRIKPRVIERIERDQVEGKSIAYIQPFIESIQVVIRFMDTLNQRARVREELCFPFDVYFDLRESHLCIPSMNTDRIKRQRGAFIFPKYVNTNYGEKSFDKIQREIENSVFQFLYTGEVGNLLVIPSQYKPKIRKELHQLGIDGGFLY